MFWHCDSLKLVKLSGAKNTCSNLSIDGMFGWCSSLEDIDFTGWSFDGVRSDGYVWAFAKCSNLKSIEGFSPNFDVIKNYRYMFYGCSSLSQDCSEWPVGTVSEDFRQGFNMEAPGVMSPKAWQEETNSTDASLAVASLAGNDRGEASEPTAVAQSETKTPNKSSSVDSGKEIAGETAEEPTSDAALATAPLIELA